MLERKQTETHTRTHAFKTSRRCDFPKAVFSPVCVCWYSYGIDSDVGSTCVCMCESHQKLTLSVPVYVTVCVCLQRLMRSILKTALVRQRRLYLTRHTCLNFIPFEGSVCLWCGENNRKNCALKLLYHWKNPKWNVKFVVDPSEVEFVLFNEFRWIEKDCVDAEKWINCEKKSFRKPKKKKKKKKCGRKTKYWKK